jgi:NAD(P)-dependent dehydrogenase (short-subunit alcohol dehydrogenase family)
MNQTLTVTSTTDDVLGNLDLTGKRVLVTGVSSGIGVETARALASRGAQVIGTARDLDKARAAIAAALGDKQNRVELIALDLAQLSSVRAVADQILQHGLPLDVIIANAGVMACPFGKTADGFETQFGTNHLGHFVLVNRLAPLLRAGSRVVVLASAGHRVADVDLEDPNFDRGDYVELIAYGRSKTANVLFAVELDRRLRDRGVRAAAVHPGAIRTTDLLRHLTPEIYKQFAEFTPSTAAGVPTRTDMKTIPQGAATSVWAGFVADADTIGGHFCEDCGVAEVVHTLQNGGVRDYAVDPERAKALWAKSEEMVGERF